MTCAKVMIVMSHDVDMCRGLHSMYKVDIKSMEFIRPVESARRHMLVVMTWICQLCRVRLVQTVLLDH